MTNTTTKTIEILATITGRGAASTVPDNAGAVDASITLDGVFLCDVTLVPDPAADGYLTTWGCPENWCSDYAALEGTVFGDADTLTDAIVLAVNEDAGVADWTAC